MKKIGEYDFIKRYIGSNEVKKIYIGSNLAWEEDTIQLPYDTPIEYLESSGTQWIDTNIIPTNEHGLKIIMSNYTPGSNDENFVGCRDSGSLRWMLNYSSGKLGSGHYNYSNTNITFNTSQTHEISLNYYNDGKCYLDSSNVTVNNSTNFTIGCTALLFGQNKLVNNSIQHLPAKYRVYSFKITRGNELILDFIPVRIGQVGYMYDKISKQLFSNQGTGDFVLGPDVNN